MQFKHKIMLPIAHFHSPFTSKFGIPRQSGLVAGLEGEIIFTPQWRNPDIIRGLEGFDYIWLIWEFSANKNISTPTVRPPRLGGNKRMGVLATRSPFRPNNIGLSSVRISQIDWQTPQGPVIHVKGADLMDGTPILDIKPYLAFTDCHPEARGGFTDNVTWNKLTVVFPDTFHALFNNNELENLRQILELDPRPHYQHQDERIYGMNYKDQDIHFRVTGDVLEVLPN